MASTENAPNLRAPPFYGQFEILYVNMVALPRLRTVSLTLKIRIPHTLTGRAVGGFLIRESITESNQSVPGGIDFCTVGFEPWAYCFLA